MANLLHALLNSDLDSENLTLKVGPILEDLVSKGAITEERKGKFLDDYLTQHGTYIFHFLCVETLSIERENRKIIDEGIISLQREKDAGS